MTGILETAPFEWCRVWEWVEIFCQMSCTSFWYGTWTHKVL